MNFDIDIVMPWVDDKDSVWQASKRKYTSDPQDIEDISDERYRDWENLKYWFRAVEKFAPWVHKVYFITCGHVPSWLNLNAEKLVHVRHEDYIPAEYLPVFSSHPIEINIHRIKGLSEHFIYFNDDTFLTQPVSPELFFSKEGLPRHPAILHAIFPRGEGGIMPHVYVSTVMAVNRHFKMQESLKRDRDKWFSIKKNGIKAIIENVYNKNFPEFPGFKNPHLPVPVLKQTMEEVWEKEQSVMFETTSHKFRDIRDINMYVFRYWELASGKFEPIKLEKLGTRVDIGHNLKEIHQMITKQTYPMLCINDMGLLTSQEEFIEARNTINDAFETILNEKSSFEL